VRLFIAIEVGPDIQRAVSRVVDELRQRAERTAPRARVSWVKAERSHLTVRFIGEADEPLHRAIVSALEPELSTRSFDLTIAGTGSFPPGRPPRVLWAGVTTGLAEIQALEREVASRLEGLPLPRPDRDYHPHLTLARVTYPAGLRPAALLSGLENSPFGTVRVEAVTLFESRLSSKEPVYLAHGRTSLRRA